MLGAGLSSPNMTRGSSGTGFTLSGVSSTGAGLGAGGVCFGGAAGACGTGFTASGATGFCAGGTGAVVVSFTVSR